MRFGCSIVLLLSGLSALGQMNTGEISGRVQDPTSSALPGATIVAQHLETGQKFTTVSNSSGEYLFAQLPVGPYSFTANATDFKQSALPRIDVHASDRLRRDFTLELGARTEVVTVEAGGVQLESAEIRDVIGHQQVTDLPVKSRQFLDLAMLSPGVVRPPGGTRGDAMQQAGNLVNVLGQRSGHNLYLMDGVAITDEHFNNMVIAPSIDAIEEVNIEKTSYAPEFGGKSGAVINVVSRSGSNDLHGSLFEFVRNNVFDAKNFFDSATAPIPPFRQNQFGGTVGGPIHKNRTFFFLSYEGQRVRKSLTQTFSVPTAAMRRGDFSGLPTIYDPTAAAGGLRQPFPNNQILRPLDPAAVALLAQIPFPNLPGIAQNLRSIGNQRINGNQYSARLDHQFSSNDATYLRASLFDAREADPFGSGVLQESLLPGFGRNLSTHAINGVAGWTHTFNANILNEARFGFLTVAGGQASPNAGNSFATQTALQGVTTNPLDIGYPQVSFGGQFTTMGDPALFTFRKNRDLEFYDNAIWHKGRHTIKFGAYAMHYNLRPVNPNGARGIFSFTPRWTSSAPGLADGSAFADFLLGYPTTAQVGLGRAALDATTNWGHFYLQDNWQITPNLKIDVGIRYEYNQNMTDANNQIAAIDTSVPGGRFVVASDGSGGISAAANALLPFLPIPYVKSSAAGWNNSLLVPRSLRLAPRAGLAWSIPGLKTVVRTGFGIYPNQAAYSIVTNLAQNLPFFVTKTVNSTATSFSPSFTTENALTANTVGTVGGNNLDHNFKIEYNEVWNFNLERELSSGTVLSAAYMGSRTVHADSGTVLNVPLPGAGAIAARRPIPQLSQIGDIRWNGWATYHALTLAAKRRFAKGLMFDANWTWSHSIDDASDPGATLNETNLAQNVYDLGAEKASSSFDHRHRVVVSFIYQVPLAKDSPAWVHAVFGQWQAGGNFTAQSGAPFTVNISSDQANIGAGPAQRPNISANPNDGPKTPQQWFSTSFFSLPALYTFGNAPRNAVIGPGLQEFDLSLQKDIRLTESSKLLFRAEAYNLFNHPNFNIPNRTAFTANFGSISSAQDSRQLQLALRLAF
ncbi:MAG TPA: carboxypeptidase regulatory-like domain-containing protein [Terriglobales bacterium]|nr:carboxypeptidase regulatory-like domain-containing protein [Terriglobales bacterium]HYL65477.1 carboxypeptidase regulatory-like domain-containing protein [Candidatus Methylomirabilis sp.]